MAEKKAVVVRVGSLPEEEVTRQLLRTRQEDREVVDTVEAELKEINGELMQAVEGWQKQYPEADAFDFGVDEKRGTLRLRVQVRPGQKKLSAERLLELGVSPATVEAAWEQGAPSAPFLEVRRVKDV